ncbi:C40 family peptidase [Rhodococcus globerulus]|uniref:C40 family peptidase n=1 Tax=Rhodococcus globerulus TaxID=33008 RepID=UPI000A8D3B35|nr:C40 family peptidase [Rhodococcus globerulus]
MIPVEALARPIIDLVATLGSGVSDSNGPEVGLRIASDVLEIAYQLGTAALGELSGGGTSTAGMSAATTMTEQTQAATRTLTDKGTDIAGIVDEATMTISAGIDELNGILQSFLGIAAKAGPALLTPPGQLMLVAAAFDHLGQAISVVERMRGDLSGSTDKMSALVPSVPLPDPAPGSTNPESGTRPAASTGSAGLQIDLPDGSVATAPNAEAAAAVRNALTQQGVPYEWGGTSPGVGLDCSGLTQWAYGQAGVDIPRLAQEQGIGSPVDQADLLPGDLAVWDGHVAMVVGNGQMIEAGDPVSVSPVRTSNIGMGFHGFYRPTE